MFISHPPHLLNTGLEILAHLLSDYANYLGSFFLLFKGDNYYLQFDSSDIISSHSCQNHSGISHLNCSRKTITVFSLGPSALLYGDKRWQGLAVSAVSRNHWGSRGCHLHRLWLLELEQEVTREQSGCDCHPGKQRAMEAGDMQAHRSHGTPCLVPRRVET